MKFNPEDVFAEIERQAPNFGIAPNVAKAFLLAENTADGVLKPGSELRGDRVSGAKARGLFQTLPSTEEALKRQGFLPAGWSFNSGDMTGQVTAGLAALKEMKGRQKNPADIMELGVMYNAGSEPWRAYRNGNMAGVPSETKGYWKKLTTALGLEPKMGAQAQEAAALGGTVSSPRAGSSSGSSSNSSLRTSIFDPTAFAAAMNSSLDFIKSGGGIDTAIASIGSAAAARKAAEQAQQAAIGQFSIDIGAAATAGAAVEASAAARRKSILDVGNLNPDTISNRFNEASELINTIDPQREKLAQDIDARQSVGLYDNPLEWLVNQVRLPGMVGQYNSMVKQQNRAIESVKELQSMAGTQQALSASIDADLITEQGRTKAAATASEAQARLSQSQVEAAGAASRDAANIVALQGQEASTAISLAQLTKQIQTENEGMSEREASKLAVKMEVDKVNKYMELIGSTTRFTPEQFKALSTDARTKLQSAAGTGVIAKRFSEAATNIDSMGNFSKIAETGDAAAVNWFKATRVAASKQTDIDLAAATKIANVSGKVIKRDEIMLANLDKMQDAYQGQTADMRTASDSNPIKLAYPAIAKMPQFANNPLAIFINKHGPLGTDPIYTKIDEKVILDRFTSGIIAGTYDAGTAAKAVADFYLRAPDVQASRTKYALFGLDKPTNGYTVRVPESGFFTLQRNSQEGGTIDLSNQAAVEAYLVKNAARKLQYDYLPATIGQPDKNTPTLSGQ